MHAFWKEHFRMNFDSFRELCQILSPLMAKRDTRFRAVIPIEKRVAIGLWRLGTGESYRSTSVTFGVEKCTAGLTLLMNSYRDCPILEAITSLSLRTEEI